MELSVLSSSPRTGQQKVEIREGFNSSLWTALRLRWFLIRGRGMASQDLGEKKRGGVVCSGGKVTR